MSELTQERNRIRAATVRKHLLAQAIRSGMNEIIEVNDDNVLLFSLKTRRHFRRRSVYKDTPDIIRIYGNIAWSRHKSSNQSTACLLDPIT